MNAGSEQRLMLRSDSGAKIAALLENAQNQAASSHGLCEGFPRQHQGRPQPAGTPRQTVPAGGTRLPPTALPKPPDPTTHEPS